MGWDGESFGLKSELMPLDEMLSILRTMDANQTQWGVAYPAE